MKNFLKRLMVGVATISAVAGVTLAATMEAEAEDTYDAAVLTKELKIPEGVIVPNLTFDFTAEKLGTEDADGNVTLDSKQPDWTIPSIEFSQDAGNPEKGLVGDRVVKATEDLMSTIKGLAFEHASVYLYKVTEVDPNKSADIISHYSVAEYTVRVYVENNDSGGVDVKGITVLKEKDDAGNDVGNKVDPTPNPGDYGGSEFRFINEFWDETNLEVEKQVKGKSADLTKDFNFEITLNMPTAVSAPAGHKIMYQLPGESSATHEYDGINPISLKLKHGEKVIFANLPVGATYTVVEKAATGYTPTAEVTGRGTHGTADAGTAGTDYTVTIGSETKLLVDAEDLGAATPIKNTTVVTNELKEPSITGVITDNLPFVLMIVVAGAGIVFLTLNKRRRAQ